MKTLKRSLSLVLVLALAFSLCSSAFAVKNFEKFKDGDKVTYIEAVDVLIGIDIVDGIDATTLSPQGTYTRAQGAALITRLMLGRAGTEKLSDKVSPFKDVPDGYWASGEINFCVNEGIIHGNGDGTFNPEGSLTGYAVMKMVLSALGYGAQGEFKGEQWMINTAKFAFSTDINLVRGIKATNKDSKDYTLAATREEAMLYVFNSFNIPMVYWSTLINEYVKSTSTHPDYAPYQFLNAPHGLYVKLGNWTGSWPNYDFVSDRDAFGYRVRTWFAKEYKISEAYRVDNMLDAVNGNTTFGDLYAKNYKFDSALEVFVNGLNISHSTLNDYLQANLTKGNLKKVFNYDGEPLTGAHITLVDNVFDDFMNVDQVIIVVEYLAKVTKVNEATSTQDRTIEIDVLTKTGVVGSYRVRTEEFSVGDHILIVPNYAGSTGLVDITNLDKIDSNSNMLGNNAFLRPISMKLAKSETSKVSAYTDATPGTSTVTIASGKYLYNFTDASDRTGFDYSADYKFYFDTEGNVIGYSKVTTKNPYLYVTQSRSQAEGTFLFHDDGKAAVKVDVTYFDGTSEVLNLEIKTATKDIPGVAADGSATTILRYAKYYTLGGIDYEVDTHVAPIPTGVYTYAKSSNGLTLVKAEDYEASVLGVVHNNARVTGTSNPAKLPLTASTTTNLVISQNGVPAGKYVGYQSFVTNTYRTAGNGKDCDFIGFLTDGNDVITDILVIGSRDRGAREFVYGVYTGDYENRPADSNWFYTFQIGEGDITGKDGDIGPASSYRTVISWTDRHSAPSPELVKGRLYRVVLDANNEVIDIEDTLALPSNGLNGFTANATVGTKSDNFLRTGIIDLYWDNTDVIVYDLRDIGPNGVYNVKKVGTADIKEGMTISYVYSDRRSSVLYPNFMDAEIIFILAPSLY